MSESIIMLGGKEFKVEKQKIKQLKKLGKLIGGVIKDLTTIEKKEDEQIAILVDSLMEIPSEAMKILVPDVTIDDIDNSYLDELGEAFRIVLQAQGFEKLKNSLAPLMKAAATLK